MLIDKKYPNSGSKHPETSNNPGRYSLIRLWPLIVPGLFVLVLYSCSKEVTYVIRLENTLDAVRVDEPIVLAREVVDKVLGNQKSANIIRIKTPSGQMLPSQTDDLDQDGQWDELVFQYSFESNEIAEVILDINGQDDASNKHHPRAHAYLGYRPSREGEFKSIDYNVRPKDHEPQSWPYLYQFEGPGWESDLIAYRIYFDKRNGKDIFGKTKKGVFLDSIGLGENYHKLQPWGMDVLKVGNSLGAGSLAMYKKDSLYRLEQTKTATYQKLADGPVRAIIKLEFGGWQVDDTSYDVDEMITIWGGKRWYHDQVIVKDASKDTLVTGIVNMFDIVPIKSYMATSYRVLSSYGKQSENKDVLGMAILAPEEQFAGFGSAPKEGKGITQTDYIKLQSNTGSYQFYFYTGWELDDKKFADQGYFINRLKHEAVKLANPIQITY